MNISLSKNVCVWASSAFFAAAAPQKPNVLFIFADDMSYETVDACGPLDIDTPNLDTLVERGATFTHTYNMGAWRGAVCVASRAMLNTGRTLWAAHQLDNRESMACKASAGEFWAQRMATVGYRTYMTGKWHVKVDAASVFGDARNVRGGMPKQTSEGYGRPKDEEDYKAGWKPWETKYGGYWEGGKHWSEVVADDAMAFLADASKYDDPFFMYIAFNAPHDPRQAPKEYIDRYPLDRIKVPENFLTEYPDAEVICGKQLRDERLMPYPRTEYAVKVNRQEYFALITHMDDQIGRILEALEKSGKIDNTYIIVTADNGLAVGHHGLAGKQNMYDHSERVPFMIAGPGVPAGTKIDTPIYLQDAMPTTLELAGAEIRGVDFRSLLPLLRGEPSRHYDSIYGAYIGTQRMIIKGQWKLIVYPQIKKYKLFNLETDPFEKTDLSSNPEYVDVLKRLTVSLEQKMDEMNDPMTSLDAADYSIPYSASKQGHE